LIFLFQFLVIKKAWNCSIFAYLACGSAKNLVSQ